MPVLQEVCVCGQPRPSEGWPVDRLLNTWIAGRFHIRRRLGMGGTGLVYLAERFYPPGPVAIKVTHDRLTELVWQQRLEREASVLQRLRLAWTVSLLEYGQMADGRHFIAMECLEGRTVQELLEQRGALPVSRAVSIVAQAAEAMAAVHAQGVIHRDLKPSNLFLLAGEPYDQLKVLDFGIALDLNRWYDIGDRENLIGTPRYIAPEQIVTPDRVDGRADIFSLGIMLNELLTGQLPFPWENTMAVLIRRLREAPLPLEVAMPSAALPDRLYRTVRRMIERDVARRFRSMGEVAGALRQVLLELKHQDEVDDVGRGLRMAS